MEEIRGEVKVLKSADKKADKKADKRADKKADKKAQLSVLLLHVGNLIRKTLK